MTLFQQNADVFAGSVPSTPRLLILIALLFVPGVYLILVLAAIVPIAFWWVLAGEFQRVSSQAEGNDGFERLIGWGAIIAAYACLRGIWVTLFHKPRFELAVELDLRNEDKLRSFITEVCESLQTSMPDSVILHAEPTFFVQNGKLKVLNSMVNGKVLAIGLPLLSGLSVNELRAVLLHEFAHFTGNDTVYSSVVLPIYVGTKESTDRLLGEMSDDSENIFALLTGLIMKIPMLIPYAILRLYLKLFRLVDMKLSRIRERRADIIAALTCGSKTFSNALTKVIRISKAFNTLSREQIVDHLKDGKMYVNYYGAFRQSLPEIWEWSSRFETEALEEKERRFDSHPTLKTRLEYIPVTTERYFNQESAIRLLHFVDSYEKRLTDAYTEVVAVSSASEVQKRKEAATPKVKKRIAYVKCPHCHMRSYEGNICSVCGKPLTSIFDPT